jgi:hypothetical protein
MAVVQKISDLMKSFRNGSKSIVAFACLLLCLAMIQHSASAQTQARRLILKDGTYQSITKYEVHGDRVRYFSAERGEWEEVPNSLIDWDATNKFEQGRSQGKLAPEAVELDKQLEAERKAERERSPQVAKGLRLPDENGVFLLDTFENEPQLDELPQSGGDVEKNSKSNILRSTVNPLASAKQTIELPGPHAKVQSHTTVPSLYLNVDDATPAATQAPGNEPPLPPNERFKIIRIDSKNGKRIAGSVKVAVTGKVKSDGHFVTANVAPMTGGWVKLSPSEPLAPGEYAVAEMLGKEGMNLYVWDFGVNPSAPSNPLPWKPESPESQPKQPTPGVPKPEQR